MSEKIFENLGKELDGIVSAGEEVLKEFEKVVEEELSEKKIEKRKKEFNEFVDELSKDFSEFLDTISKEVKVSKIKIFNIRMIDFDKAIIKYNKKGKKITISKEGSDKSFDIKLVKDIKKKQVKKILESVRYNEEKNLINITIKRKYLR